MLRRGGIRYALALALALALASPAFAGPLALTGGPGQAAGEGLSRLWAEARSWIAAALPWATEITTSNRGSYIDPDGAADEPGDTGESDRGPYIDPNG